MAAQSNRSPSPLSSRPSNPVPRNSENNSSIRRSSNNNSFPKPSVLTNPKRLDPVTPANSPSDFARRRCSVGKESNLATGSSLKHDDKENSEKEEISKAFKFQSPVKGSKNFMAPTISAASKFTPSPRKKVLVDRNEPVRTSISLCDGKATFFSEIESNESEIKDNSVEIKGAVVQDAPPLVPKPSRRVTFSEVSEVVSDSHYVSESLSESVITDSDYNLKKMESKDCIAPLDADPSLPPYDPQTNYLSPRPQFLHYKPNPRIEILKEKNGEGFKQLEDLFLEEIISQNFSDSESTVDEESNTEEDSQKSEEESNTEDCSTDTVLGFDELKEYPISSTVSSAISVENLVQKGERKSKFKCVSMLLILLITACVSIAVTRSPLLDQVVVKDMSFTDLSNFYRQSLAAAYMKVNFQRKLSFSPMSSISKLLDSLGKEEKLVAIQFMNISDLQKDIIMNGGNVMENHLIHKLVDNVEEEAEDKFEEDLDTVEQEVYEEYLFHESCDNDSDTGDELVEIHVNTVVISEKSEDQLVDQSAAIVERQTEAVFDINTETLISDNSEESHVLELAIPEAVSDINTETLISDNSKEGQLVMLDQEVEYEAETVEEVEKFSENTIITTSSDFADITTTTALDHEIPSEADASSSSEDSKSENKFLVIGATSLFMAAILVATGGTLLFYKRKNNARSEDVVMTQKQNIIYHEKKQQQQFSQNLQTEVDVVGESCPSEMSSSFQKSASSYQRKYSRRDSLASTASEYSASPSYGSFTTYERISIKNANGDEGIVTPVRRSSRIRTKIISP